MGGKTAITITIIAAAALTTAIIGETLNQTIHVQATTSKIKALTNIEVDKTVAKAEAYIKLTKKNNLLTNSNVMNSIFLGQSSNQSSSQSTNQDFNHDLNLITSQTSTNSNTSLINGVKTLFLLF